MIMIKELNFLLRKMLSLVIAESALELIPKKILGHPSVRNQATRTGRNPDGLLLDRSIHHSAMIGLKNAERRGRPDLIHISLLTVVSTHIYTQNMARVYLHTIDDKVISLGNQVRLPKSYDRFESLMSHLFREGIVESGEKQLLSIEEMNFRDLIGEIAAEKVICLSSVGRMSDAEMVIDDVLMHDNVVIVIGGFPRGHFSRNVLDNADAIYSIQRTGLEAHVVCSRILYEYEKKMKI